MKTRYPIFALFFLALAFPFAVHAVTSPVKPPLFGWQVWPASGERILPTSQPPADATNASVRIASARGAVASASFAIRSMKAIRKLTIEPSDLLTADGRKIDSARFDLRVVKCWYQDANGWFAGSRGHGASVLVPELLLHDDTLVQVDPKTRENLIRTSPAGATPVYHRIAAAKGGAVTPSAPFVAADDAEKLQPLPMAKKEARQFYLTIDIPGDASPGIYHGRLSLVADGQRFGHLDLDVRVIPHLLGAPVSRFSGRGNLDGKKVITGSSPAVVTTAPEPFETVAALPVASLSSRSIALLAESGIANCVLPPSALPKLAGYFGRGLPRSLWIAAPGALEAIPAGAPAPSAAAKVAKAALQTGVQDVRVFLPSRISGPGLDADRKAIEAVDDTGARAWVFAEDETYRAAGASIRSPMRRGYPPVFAGLGSRMNGSGGGGGAYGNVEYSDSRQCERWHAIGSPYYLCSTFPAGIEDPSVWRRRLGVECYYFGYDGFVLPSLIEEADPWNDWASADHRSRTFLYPTRNGLVPTLAWEGIREAVTDVRYLAAVRRLADAVRYAGMDNARLDIEGRKASMWIDQLPVRKVGLDTMRLDAITWIIRLEALMAKAGR